MKGLRANKSFVIFAFIFSLLLLSAFAPNPPKTEAQTNSVSTKIFGNPNVPEFDNLTLVIWYENGSFQKNVEWENIDWANVKYVAIKNQFGVGGFWREYGAIVWCPNSTLDRRIYEKPLWFVFIKFHAKVGGTWYESYITKDIAKTPRFFVIEPCSGNVSGEWEIGWNGTVVYGAKELPVYVGLRASRCSSTMKIKTNVTTPIALDGYAIEYQLYLNPYYADKAKKNVKYIRVHFQNGSYADYTIEQAMDFQGHLSNMITTFSFLNQYKNVSVNTFDFSDVFGMGGTNLAKIEKITLPNGINTYVVKVGSVFGSLNAGETFSVDPALAFPSKASVMWEDIGFEGAYNVRADLTVNLTKWNDEAFLEIEPFLKVYHFHISYKGFSSEKKVKFVSNDVEFHFYPKNISEYGDFEYEIILKKAPLSNTFVFPISTQNLKFYYQPPLYEEYGFSEPFSNSTFFVNATHVMEFNGTDWITTTYRPENVVGSYAVYHAYKRDNQYKTGKAFHIFRPKAVDSTGNEVWCDLNIDEAKGLLTVTIPQEFLDKAVYSITIDPTFGYTTEGGSSEQFYNQISGSHFVIGQNGQAQNITVYVGSLYGCTIPFKCAIYKYSDNSFVEGTEETSVSSSSPQWVTLNMLTTVQLTANTEYWLVAWGGTDASNMDRPTIYFDSSADAGGTQTQTYVSGTGGWPDPWNPTSLDSIYSIYCTYTLSNQIPSIGEFQSPSTVYANKYFFLNATINDGDGVADFVNATIEISNSIILKWDNSTDTFSEYQDTNNYCTLDASGSFKTSVNSTAYKLSFKIKLTWSFPEGYVSIIATNTLVYDSQGASGSNSQTNLFYFEDDLIISSASVDDSRIDPSQLITFTGTIYYEGTTTPPEDTSGITAKVELSGVVKGSTTTIDANGDFSITISGESAVNSYSYNIYAVTDQATTQNQTVEVIVNRIKVISISVDDSRINIGATATITVTLHYEYDDSAVTSGNFNLNGLTLTHQANGQWQTTDSKSSQQTVTYNSLSGSDGAYGISTINMNGQSATVTWDALKIVNLQTVEYLGSGQYRYTAQIVYAIDNSAISGATVAVALPSGTEMSTTTSNVTGWFSFVLSQSNATESGLYTIYGVNDGTYGITYKLQNATFTLYAWALQTVDVDDNAVSSTTVTVKKDGQSVWSGNPATIRVPAATYSITVTWLQNLNVHSSSVTVSADKTSSLQCTLYPFSLNNQVWHVGSNATIQSATFSSRTLTVEFNDSTGNYILVVDCTQKPTYIYNYTYTLSDIFGSYLVIPHYANFTFKIIYQDWGMYVTETTNGRIVDMTYSNYIMTIKANGTSGQVATLKLYCGNQGNPAETEGFTTTSYSASTKTLTGTYTFASQKTLTLKWQVSGGSSSTGGGATTTLGPLIVSVKAILASPIQAGTATTAKIEIRWSGQTTITVDDIKFKEYAEWFKPPPMPIKATMGAGQDQGVYTLNVKVEIPESAQPGEYTVPCELTISTPQGATTTVSTYTTFTVKGATYGVPDVMTYVFLGIIGLIVVGAALRETSKRKYYK